MKNTINKQKIVIPLGIGLAAVLQVGQLSWLVKLWPVADHAPSNSTCNSYHAAVAQSLLYVHVICVFLV